MYQMTEEERVERARVKAVHQAARSCAPVGDRYRNLVWGFVRGFPYRRMERSHHVSMLDGDWSVCAAVDNHYRAFDGQWFYEHNMPSEGLLFELLKKVLPGVTKEEVAAWTRDMSGAIPPPPPRVKRPREEAAPQIGA